MTTSTALQAAEVPVVSSANHLLGIIQGILQSGRDTNILIADKGKISIFPSRKEYYANVLDMAEFCRMPAQQFKVQAASDATLQLPLTGRKNIKELLWHAAFHISEKGMIEGCSPYQIVQFRHWPNLTRLPVTPNAARICALLTRHSYTLMLVNRILGIEKEEVFQIYSAAYASGIADVIHDIGRKQTTQSEEEALASQSSQMSESGFFRSLFSKIAGL